ncbi:MAG TPA: hypothetical protein VG796_08025 [Verrucomicrobiales bacterium]|nr:hypothetical protein [Verrucomicrobiales bacterium]
MLRTLTVTVVATVIVALGSAVIMQRRALVAVQVKDSAQDEKLEATSRRIEALLARIDELVKVWSERSVTPKPQ